MIESIMNDVRLSSTAGAAVTIRGLAPQLKSLLRVRAAHNDRSMEAEARAILEAALSAPDEDATDFGAFARGLFAPLGGVELELPARGPAREPPTLDPEQGQAVEVSLAATESAQSSSISPEQENPPVTVKARAAASKPKGRRP